MNTIIVEHTHTGSFNSTARICRLAKQQGVEVRCFIIDRWVSAKPGDDAVSVYRHAFHEDTVAGVKHDEI